MIFYMPSTKHNGSRLVQELIAVPKVLGKNVSSAAINDIMEDIKETIIIPLFESKTDEYKTKLNNYRISFEFKLKSLLQVILKSTNGELPIDYEYLRKPIEQNQDIIPSKIATKILIILDRILEHDKVLLEIDAESPEKLEEILNQIDVTELQNNVYNSLLTFFCILYYYNEDKNEDKKLSKFLEIGEKCSQVVEDYVHTIYVPVQPG